MKDYRLVTGFSGVQRTTDRAWIPDDLQNRDYQEYLHWLALGNTPEPAIIVKPAEPSIDLALQNPALRAIVQALADATGVPFQTLIESARQKLAEK